MANGITNKILRQNKCHAAVCWILTNAGEKPEYNFHASSIRNYCIPLLFCIVKHTKAYQQTS